MENANNFFEEIKQMASNTGTSLDDIRKCIEKESKPQSNDQLILFKPVLTSWGEEDYYILQSGIEIIPNMLIKSEIQKPQGNPSYPVAIVLYDFNQMKRTVLTNTDKKLQCVEKDIENQDLFALQCNGIPDRMMNNQKIKRPLRLLLG
jgi:hypothetical protein